jgi:acetylornithine deacetylase/succinyl-diaminopimelate desuccinylase-like protein
MTTDRIKQAVDHVHANRDAYMERFYDFLRIPSISTDPAFKPDIQRGADWVLSELKRLGFDKVSAMPTEGHPLVYGEHLKAGPDKPTVLVYAHYDVQPVDPLNLWETPPFEPTVRNGKLYARGASDDKSGIFGNLLVIESMLETAGSLPFNVKVFFEGEEESGSPSMESFIAENRDLLKADLLIISDGGSDTGQPIIYYSTRGIIGIEVLVTGATADLHSGLVGGAVRNPAHVVGKIIASFHDENGHIMVPGAYDGATPLTDAERAYFDKYESVILEGLHTAGGDFKLWGEPGYNFIERATARPSIDVNGIYGGYQGDGGKTIIPSKAGFKLTMRIAPGQDADDIKAKLVKHIESFKEDTIDIQFVRQESYAPSLMLFEGPIADAQSKALHDVWGKEPLKLRSGGSVPIIGMFQKVLGLPIIGCGYSTGGSIHAPNEFLDIEHFWLNVDTGIHFFYHLADVKLGG